MTASPDPQLGSFFAGEEEGEEEGLKGLSDLRPGQLLPKHTPLTSRPCCLLLCRGGLSHMGGALRGPYTSLQDHPYTGLSKKRDLSFLCPQKVLVCGSQCVVLWSQAQGTPSQEDNERLGKTPRPQSRSSARQLWAESKQLVRIRGDGGSSPEGRGERPPARPPVCSAGKRSGGEMCLTSTDDLFI